MILDAPEIKRVMLAGGRTDLRMGIYGLASVVQRTYKMNPLEDGTLWLFCGNKRTRIKGLIYEQSVGFVMLTINRTEGVFEWPRGTEEAVELSIDDYYSFLLGEDVVPTLHRKSRAPKGSDRKQESLSGQRQG